MAVIFLVGITHLYLRWLNVSHSNRRVALGKSAEVLDRSLETAESVDIMDSMHEHESDESDDRGFSDATDLENEDFVFVY